MFCTFSLQNMLFTTAACNFWFIRWPPDSAPAALTGLLFDWPDTRIIEKTQHFVTSLTFSADVSSFTWLWHYCIFCRLTWLLYCCAMHLLFNSPYCRKFLFKLPSIIYVCIHAYYESCNPASSGSSLGGGSGGSSWQLQATDLHRSSPDFHWNKKLRPQACWPVAAATALAMSAVSNCCRKSSEPAQKHGTKTSKAHSEFNSHLVKEQRLSSKCAYVHPAKAKLQVSVAQKHCTTEKLLTKGNSRIRGNATFGPPKSGVLFESGLQIIESYAKSGCSTV